MTLKNQARYDELLESLEGYTKDVTNKTETIDGLMTDFHAYVDAINVRMDLNTIRLSDLMTKFKNAPIASDDDRSDFLTFCLDRTRYSKLMRVICDNTTTGLNEVQAWAFDRRLVLDEFSSLVNGELAMIDRTDPVTRIDDIKLKSYESQLDSLNVLNDCLTGMVENSAASVEAIRKMATRIFAVMSMNVLKMEGNDFTDLNREIASAEDLAKMPPVDLQWYLNGFDSTETHAASDVS